MDEAAPPMGATEDGEVDVAEVGKKRYRLLDSIKKAVFVVGSVFVVFIAFRNSVTWHAQQFWGASGDLWQRQWLRVFEWFDGDAAGLGVGASFVATMLVFWLGNLFFIAVDMTGRPEFVLAYKIQPSEQVSARDFSKAVGRVLFNQTVVGVPLLFAITHLMLWRGCSFGAELPTFAYVVFELFVFIWVEEFAFYYSHRLFHHPKLYKHIHKIHHEWTAPIGIVSIYAHPLEHVLSNSLPMALGPLLCGSHIATTILWFCVGLLSTTVSHCGYHMPFLPSPEAHDFHHLKFNQNFGVLGVLDRLHGTDVLFRQSRAYERHFLLLSLTPVRQTVPETKQKCA